MPGTPEAGKEGRIVLTGNAWHCICCKDSSLLICVLGLAGMELIFFVAAAVVICFRFVTKPSAGNTMMFYLWFCTASRLVFLSLPTLKTDWGVCKRLGRGTTRQISQRNQRGIPYCVKSSNKKGRGRLASFCLETGSTSLTVWAGKQFPLHHLFCCVLFLPYYFFTFYLFFFYLNQ